ncbi:hypothetical protein CO046_02015 [Candidatus Peregrinibacteria bacterium CG_4_9_14_0_2_um_filter_53_11]|nr:MAG: hypothetical protein CO046_02015 [Candidatus Peregrinibacteria bacterium CG_4_9_14_0_2_um_filter_53_11]
MSHPSETREFLDYYEEFKNAIFSYLLYRVGYDRATAEDLTSEVFIKAYENFHRYDQTRSFKTWIFTIAHNHLINYVQSRKLTVPLNEDIKTPANEKGATFAEQTDHDMQMEQVMQLVSDLPETQRELLTMRYVNDLSNSEIAAILGKDEGAVRTALSRAVGQLRNKYSTYLSQS